MLLLFFFEGRGGGGQTRNAGKISSLGGSLIFSCCLGDFLKGNFQRNSLVSWLKIFTKKCGDGEGGGGRELRYPSPERNVGNILRKMSTVQPLLIIS